VLIGAKSKGRGILAYSKKLDDGTILYLEEVLDSKRNKALRGKTMYKRKNTLEEQSFLRIITMTRKVDLTGAKMFGPGVTGGYPDFVTTAISDP
jgi:hypothetical protein